jgi:hypothetical protein
VQQVPLPSQTWASSTQQVEPHSTPLTQQRCSPPPVREVTQAEAQQSESPSQAPPSATQPPWHFSLTQTPLQQ